MENIRETGRVFIGEEGKEICDIYISYDSKSEEAQKIIEEFIQLCDGKVHLNYVKRKEDEN